MITLEKKIARLYKNPFQVKVHENATTYLRAERKKGVLCLHMHRLFNEAPTPVLEAVLRFAQRKDARALGVIRQMADIYFSENPAEPAKLEEKGEAYDLRKIYNKLKAKYFKPSYEALIGWSDKEPKGSFRYITFGSYDRHRNQIRINPVLDNAAVPAHFVEFVVYHEMLHAVCLPIVDKRGRTWVHTAEFKAKEKEFGQYEEAKEWEKTSLSFLKKQARGKRGRA